MEKAVWAVRKGVEGYIWETEGAAKAGQRSSTGEGGRVASAATETGMVLLGGTRSGDSVPLRAT